MPHATKRPLHVAPQLAEPLRATFVTLRGAVERFTVAARELDVAELSLRLGACVIARLAGRRQLVGSHVEIELQLGVEIRADARRTAPRQAEERMRRAVTHERSFNGPAGGLFQSRGEWKDGMGTQIRQAPRAQKDGHRDQVQTPRRPAWSIGTA